MRKQEEIYVSLHRLFHLVVYKEEFNCFILKNEKSHEFQITN